MAKSRAAVAVSLTAQQRRELERIWFYWGNYGPKTTKGNHSFIQGLLERGQDERPLKQKGYQPTKECEEAVERALHLNDPQQLKAQSSEAGSCDESVDVNTHLRVVHSATSKPKLIDPKPEDLIDKIRQRQ